MTRTLAFAVLIAFAGGCGTRSEGPPDIHADRSACAHCGMLISEEVYAAAYRTPGAEARLFDDIGCLLAAMGEERHRDALSIWVHDTESRTWMDAHEATFVRSASLTTPMGGGVIAFRQARSARAAAERHGGEVVGSLAALGARAPATRMGEMP